MNGVPVTFDSFTLDDTYPVRLGANALGKDFVKVIMYTSGVVVVRIDAHGTRVVTSSRIEE